MVTYLSGGRIQGSSTFPAGKVGTGAGNFDGSDNLNFTGNDDMDGDFTVAFWFQRKQASPQYMTAYNQMNAAMNDDRIQIGTQGGGASAAWEIYAASKVLDGTTPAIDTWYHLALTGSGTTWKWYENGVEIDSTSSGTTATRDNDGLVTIMGEASGAFTNGYMDEFCQYDRALSTAELLSLADGSKKPNDATLDTSNSLVLYLPMDTVSSGNWYDDTSGTSQAISTTGDPAQITTIPQDEKASITNVPIGTRYEETDTRKIFYNANNGLKSSGGTWLEKGTASGAAGHTYTRGVIGGGYSVTNIMEYITIDTTGDTTDFGDLTVARKLLSGLSSTTRGCFGGGEPVSMTDIIDYITIATTGDAVDFGNLTAARANTPAPASSATRGLWMGGYASGGNSDIIDYITIATLGNATDFGNLTQARNTPGGLSDDTRACCFGGLVSAYYNIIDYVTIATTGNATDFGDIATARYGMSGGEDATRGIMAGGKVNTSSTWYDVIEYITIQTIGNATDFGDLSVARAFGTMCSGNTRAVWAGGNESGASKVDVMEYITIQTTGNVTDFGDLSTTRADLGACEG